MAAGQEQYPPVFTDDTGGLLCCGHLGTMHDRAHCLHPRCECTREAWVLRRQREMLAAQEAAREEARQERAEGVPDVPPGYEAFEVVTALCPSCGCLVGDTVMHDTWHQTLLALAAAPVPSAHPSRAP